jgi:hypothetical protein
MPMNAKMAVTTMKIITETTAIANAISQPQSKKCLISPSQTMNIIMAAIIPPMKRLKSPTMLPITIPRVTIQIASVNFAFSLPTSVLPTIQRMGETTIMPTMMLINNPMISMSIRSLTILSLQTPLIK